MSAPLVLAVQSDPTDPPGLVGEWLARAGVAVEVVAAYAGQPVPVAVPSHVHGVLPLGGAMAAWEDELAPWLPATRDLLADAMAREVPVLGLCLGGQLLAAATGGRVALGPVAEVGVGRVHVTPAGAADPVLGAAPWDGAAGLPAAQWHQDHITDLPPTAVLLATGTDCPVQAFRVGVSGYGLQFHPEVDDAVVATWCVEADPALVRAGRRGPDVVADVAAARPDLVRAWQPVTQAWAGLVRIQATRAGGDRR